MERIDKIIASQGKYSRSEVKKLIMQKRVIVDGNLITRPETKVNEKSSIEIDGNKIDFKKNTYKSCGSKSLPKYSLFCSL